LRYRQADSGANFDSEMATAGKQHGVVTARMSGHGFARELGSLIADGAAPPTAFAVRCGPETYRSDIRQDDGQDR
jgi:hypothetical protein